MALSAILGNEERLAAAVAGRDARFDGWVFLAVTSTRIYCRPSCPAVKPKREHMRFYASAAAAQEAGFRACKRCRPDAAPGSPAWDWRSDVAARAMRLIGEGVVDREGATGLAARLGYSLRQLERLLIAEVGAGPAALARAQRAQCARVLIESTSLEMGRVAFAAGFASIRAFNRTVAEVYACSPTELRQRAAARGDGSSDAGGVIGLRLAYREPFEASNLFGHLAAAAAPGVEEWRAGAYRRTLRLPHGPGVASLRPGPGYVECRLRLADVRDVSAAVARCRRALDLDADPVAAAEVLEADPLLGPSAKHTPGRRVPRKADSAEYALRAVIGQQVSTAAAATIAARLAEQYGEAVADPDGGLGRLFPSPERMAEVDPADLPMPGRRKRTVLSLAAALADGRVDVGPGADWASARAALALLPGVGPWTIEMIAMRALGDPDAFPVGDLGLVRGAERLGLPASPKALAASAEAWRPWRAYATQYLWATSDHPTNKVPTGQEETAR
ncbi:helix-turn-helix domain-containing protein [Glycomyces sp. L485]|uniref:DNA-3-methyladenine glycosylase 2 family protein n=1 Tax=Glycomyces sp. L485 TaxID=2909235 RepID=UPI001F4B8FAC|nr:AlkA N-terminal domain-containing protein [Glycomyces sp. L485]MCH7231506.1 helix-turn-helix domain-containing protein [Glycomyces sp. L485]